MFKKIQVMAAVLAMLLAVGLTGCEDDDCPTCEDTPTAPAQAFVGSDACAECHQQIYDTFIESGHPYKLTEVTGSEGPTYPWDSEHASGAIVSMDGPPPGTDWTDYSWVIGGFGWKARFVKPDGLVYTTGTEAQLNLWGDGVEWVPYTQDQDKPYNYGCFRCHTTGASPSGTWTEDQPDGFGTFAFGGVQCEACHGRGAQHAFDPQVFEMEVDDSPELCGGCHYRDSQNRVAVKGGYIRHHEQYDEIIHSPHAGEGCSGCHDPHASVVYDDIAMGDGVRQDCTASGCHTGEEAVTEIVYTLHNQAADCVDCHMPLAAKSARATDNPYVADVHSHTFTIETAAVGRDEMWTADGKFLKLDEQGRGRVTLDFACYSCHRDDAGVGGSASQRSLAELSAYATGMHVAPGKVASR